VGEVDSTTGCAVLAVLPFENLQRDEYHDYVANGMTEETIAALGQVDPERLSVIGRTLCMAYRQNSKSTGEIGSELGADFLFDWSSSLRGRTGPYHSQADSRD
jgi:TolB-like protein